MIIPDVVHIVSFITLEVKNSIISLVCILFLFAKLKNFETILPGRTCVTLSGSCCDVSLAGTQI